MSRRDEIEKHYAEVARAVSESKENSGASSCCCGSEERLYPEDVREGLPVDALRASRGCGNPLGQVELVEGMRVLDLGSGGGIDCLIAAAEVGPSGHVYGLDMTDEMLKLAEENRSVARAENVEFLKGFIEDIPLPDACVDIVTSNCVINLSEDKPRVLSEAYRVLAPRGRFIVADIIACKPGFAGEAGIEAARVFGCRSGVVSEAVYRQMMHAAGFEDVSIDVYKTYSYKRVCEKARSHNAPELLEHFSADELESAFGGAFISGTKR